MDPLFDYSELSMTADVRIDPFTYTDVYGSRDRQGKHRQVEIDKLAITMNATGASSVWGRGFFLRADGTVGKKVASQVLIPVTSLPVKVRSSLYHEFDRLLSEASQKAEERHRLGGY